MQNPISYKTQSGLINALERNSHKLMDIKLAWWFYSAEYALINNWGWTPEDAAVFIYRYKPTESAYKGESLPY